MKLVKLLDKAMKQGGILCSKNSKLSMRYCKKIDSFAVCDPYTGIFVPAPKGIEGCFKDWKYIPDYSTVRLSGNILESNDWELKMHNENTEIKVGDKFNLGVIRYKVEDKDHDPIISGYSDSTIGKVVEVYLNDKGEDSYYNIQLQSTIDCVFLISKEKLLDFPKLNDE